jgi:hypothetical protein
MEDSTPAEGPGLSAEQLSYIRSSIAANPAWSRWRLSRQIAEVWQWRGPSGALRDMAVRNLLNKLDARGLIVLPAARQAPSSAPRRLGRDAHRYEGPPIDTGLEQLRPVSLKLVESPQESELARALFASYHYLGEGGPAGAKLAYLARDNRRRLLACVLFCSAAWKVGGRDNHIGWSASQREKNLRFVANNTRFLILPWVRVPNLASCLLGRCLRRLSWDWENKYGNPIHLVETFVESGRFTGACYRAANFMPAGRTGGRGRNDRRHTLSVPVKEVYLYPLCKDYRIRLQNERGAETSAGPGPAFAPARQRQLSLCLEQHSTDSSNNGDRPSSRIAPASGPSNWP